MLTKQDENKKLSYLIAAILILYLFYYSYRYIFQYNAEMTSPTYADTPFVFQIGKYILLAVLLVCSLFAIAHSPIQTSAPHVLVMIFIILFQCVYSFFTKTNVNDIILCICLCPTLILIMVPDKINAGLMDRVCVCSLYFTIFYELIQILLYIFVGRLPALGYDTGNITDVRFGGAWDDPNGFSLVLSFLIPFAYTKYKSIKRILIVGVLLLFLILTWALTGIVTFLVVLLGLLVSKAIHYKHYTKRMIIKFTIIACAVMIFIAIFVVWQKDAIVEFIRGKAGSINGHLESFDFSKIYVLTFLGIVPAPTQMESGVMALIYHGGIIHLLAFYGVGIVGVFSCRSLLKRVGKQDRYYPLYFGMFYYMIACLIANINLPVVYLFSNIGMFCLFVAISLKSKPRKYELLCRPIKDV